MKRKAHVRTVRLSEGQERVHVDRIKQAIHTATPFQFIAGFFWYPVYHEAIVSYGKVLEVSPAQSLALFSILSPMRRIEVNWRLYKELVDSNDPFSISAPVIERIKCYGMIEDNNFSCLSGMKVNAFYSDLSGDYSRVCVDRHVASYLFERYIDGGITDKVYEYVENIFVIAAKELGLPPAIVQAIVWLIQRDEKGIDNRLDVNFGRSIMNVIALILKGLEQDDGVEVAA